MVVVVHVVDIVLVLVVDEGEDGVSKENAKQLSVVTIPIMKIKEQVVSIFDMMVLLLSIIYLPSFALRRYELELSTSVCYIDRILVGIIFLVFFFWFMRDGLTHFLRE